jgi:hypothetical protein
MCFMPTKEVIWPAVGAGILQKNIIWEARLVRRPEAWLLGVFVLFGDLPPAAAQIEWGASHQYDTGFNPSVAVSGSTVVEVHNAANTAGPLWFRMGQVSGQTEIQWGASH